MEGKLIGPTGTELARFGNQPGFGGSGGGGLGGLGSFQMTPPPLSTAKPAARRKTKPAGTKKLPWRPMVTKWC